MQITYNFLLVALGIAILAVAWLPSLLKKYPLSYPVIFIAMGIGIYSLPLGLPVPDPLAHKTFTTHLTEICVIVALTSTGLKIDRRFNFATWVVPLRLATLTMILTIGILAVLAWLVAGLLPASAVLLAAAMAPTDPVLASDTQVGDPGEGGEDNVRFALTGEAGLNDGLAFPFVHLALALLPVALSLEDRLLHWLWKDIAYRLMVGLAAGWLSGKLLSYLILGLPKRFRIQTTAYGFVALAVTFTTYGLTELAQGYGFLAVFIAAITLRGYERTHHHHREMHDFSDQIERLLIVIVLFLFGGAIMHGLLNALTWQGALLGVVFVFLVRPLAGMITLLGKSTTLPERWVIAGFGIRGIGSFFYLAYGVGQADFPQARELWAIAGFIVLLSVTVHGIMATPVMNWIDQHEEKTPIIDDSLVEDQIK